MERWGGRVVAMRWEAEMGVGISWVRLFGWFGCCWGSGFVDLEGEEEWVVWSCRTVVYCVVLREECVWLFEEVG